MWAALDSVAISRGMYGGREIDRGVVGSARFCHLTARYVCVCVYIHREREEIEGLWGALDSVTLLRGMCVCVCIYIERERGCGERSILSPYCEVLSRGQVTHGMHKF